jgi:hypothetical protein
MDHVVDSKHCVSEVSDVNRNEIVQSCLMMRFRVLKSVFRETDP